jgi:hypothetical protein
LLVDLETEHVGTRVVADHVEIELGPGDVGKVEFYLEQTPRTHGYIYQSMARK